MISLECARIFAYSEARRNHPLCDDPAFYDKLRRRSRSSANPKAAR